MGSLAPDWLCPFPVLSGSGNEEAVESWAVRRCLAWPVTSSSVGMPAHVAPQTVCCKPNVIRVNYNNNRFHSSRVLIYPAIPTDITRSFPPRCFPGARARSPPPKTLASSKILRQMEPPITGESNTREHDGGRPPPSCTGVSWPWCRRAALARRRKRSGGRGGRDSVAVTMRSRRDVAVAGRAQPGRVV